MFKNTKLNQWNIIYNLVCVYIREFVLLFFSVLLIRSVLSPSHPPLSVCLSVPLSLSSALRSVLLILNVWFPFSIFLNTEKGRVVGGWVGVGSGGKFPSLEGEVHTHKISFSNAKRQRKPVGERKKHRVCQIVDEHYLRFKIDRHRPCIVSKILVCDLKRDGRRRRNFSNLPNLNNVPVCA